MDSASSLFHLNLSSTWVFDIEGDNLYQDIKHVWCLVAKTVDRKNTVILRPHELAHGIPAFFEREDVTAVVGHNIINFDIPVLNKLYNVSLRKGVAVIDTFILSQMLHPDSEHGLEDYFPESKVQNDDWGRFTEHMLHRCEVDVDLSIKLFLGMLNEMYQHYKLSNRIDWYKPYLMEQIVAEEVTNQGIRGCPINVDSLNDYINLLSAEIDAMHSKVKDLLGVYVERGTTVTKVFKLNGEYQKAVESYWGGAMLWNVAGPYTKVTFKQVQLTQHDKVKEVLQSLGWIPTQYTDKGSPKLPKGSEWDDVAEATDSDELRTLALYGGLKNRLDILLGWKDKLRADGKITHGAFTCGTPTARFRHSIIVNVPRVTVNKKTKELVYYPDKQSSVFGTEMRSLIHCGKLGWKQVGWDLAGIELRMLAHFMNDREFIDVVLDGDVHTFFWSKVTNLVASRDDWKSCFYALIARRI